MGEVELAALGPMSQAEPPKVDSQLLRLVNRARESCQHTSQWWGDDYWQTLLLSQKPRGLSAGNDSNLIDDPLGLWSVGFIRGAARNNLKMFQREIAPLAIVLTS